MSSWLSSRLRMQRSNSFVHDRYIVIVLYLWTSYVPSIDCWYFLAFISGCIVKSNSCWVYRVTWQPLLYLDRWISGVTYLLRLRLNQNTSTALPRTTCTSSFDTVVSRWVCMISINADANTATNPSIIRVILIVVKIRALDSLVSELILFTIKLSSFFFKRCHGWISIIGATVG